MDLEKSILHRMLLKLIKKPAKYLNTSGVVRTVLTGLSKTYGCLPHDLHIAKLAAYVFRNIFVALSTDYFTNRLQRVKLESTLVHNLKFSEVVPQGSILRPILLTSS